MSLIPVANLPPVSTLPVELVAKFAAGVVDIGGKFATGVVDTGGAPWNDTSVIFKGLGEDDSWKKNHKQKISWHCPFKAFIQSVEFSHTTTFWWIKIKNSLVHLGK